MAIIPAISTAVLTAIDDLQAEGNIPATISLKAIAGSIQGINATCQQVSLESIMAELEHIIQAHPIVIAGAPAGVTDWGYTQAELEALS